MASPCRLSSLQGHDSHDCHDRGVPTFQKLRDCVDRAKRCVDSRDFRDCRDKSVDNSPSDQSFGVL